MPDIFDQIHDSASTAAPSAGGDVFDQIHAQAAGPQGGDVFDQIHAASHLAAPPPGTAFLPLNAPAPNVARQGFNFDQMQQQQIAQANAQRGTLASNLIEALHPGANLMAGLERGLAPAVGLVSPDAARNMTDAATTLEQTRGNGGMSSLPGQLAGGLVKYSNPLVAAGLGAEEAAGEDQAAKARGEHIDTLDEIAHVAGKGAIDAIVSKVFAGKPGGGSIGGQAEKLIQNYVTRNVPQYVAKYGAKAAVGALTNDAAQLAEQTLAKNTTQPNTQIGQGLGMNTLLGAGIPMLHEAVASRFAGPEQSNAGTQEHTAADRPAEPTPEATPPNLLQKMREQQAAKEQPQPSAAETTPAPTPATADTANGPTPAPEAAKHPATLDNAAEVGKWYGKTFNDDKNAPTIQALASMAGDQKYVLADVDPSKVNPSNLMPGDKDQSKVDAIAAMPPEQRAALPPTIMAGNGNDLLVADGSHRTLAAQQAGDKTMRAYVPESYVGKDGVTAMGQAKEAMSRIEQQRNLIAAGGRKGAVALPNVDLGPLKKSWDSVNRVLGTGANLSEGDRDTALNLRTSLGEQDLHRVRTEAALKPYRDQMENWTPGAKAQWVDQIEAGQPSPDPKMQPAADLSRALNDQNIKEGQKYGLNTSKWEGDWIGHLAEFPDDAGKPATGGRSSIAGSQSFLKGRRFDTFTDFKNFVEANGGKLKYDNPMDMLLAKQMEVRRSIEARKSMYGEEDRGQLKWVPDGTPPPDDMNARLDDRLAKQERPEIAPKDMVARLAQMQHFDAQKFIQSPEWQSKAQTLRPGDTLPADFTYTGQKKTGQYAGSENVAGLFNNLISDGIGKHLPVWDQVVQMKRAVTSTNLGLSAVHAVLETFGNAVQSVGRSMDNAVHGEWDLAAKNAARALPFVQAKFGGEIGEQAQNPAAHPQLEPLVQASTEGGNKFNIKSVLNETNFQKAAKAWDEGLGAKALAKGVQGVWEGIHSPLFDHFIPALKRAAKAAAAETALRRGMSGDELRRHMGLATDDIDNMLGSVNRTHQFQHKMVTDVEDLLFSAPKFGEGTLRFAGSVSRDTLKAISDLAGGKAPKMTPAMYTAVAGVMTHAVGAALTQMIYTKATTGTAQLPTSAKDYFAPRTGRKNEAGRDERISMLSPFSFLFSAAQSGTRSAVSRVSPLWKGVVNATENQDEHGVQIRNKNDSGGKQVLDTAKYLGKQALPFSVQNMMESAKPGQSKTADAQVGNFLGFKFSHPVNSKAEQTAYDILASRNAVGGKTQEEADRSALISRFANDLHNKAPDAAANIRAAMRTGKLRPADSDVIRKRAAEPSGLVGLVKDNNIHPDELMEQVWAKATPDERKQIQWAVRGRIGRSETLAPDVKRKYLAQIGQDVRSGQ